MEDNAQKICNQLWTWYKRCRDKEKDNAAWERLLNDGEDIVNQYRGNEDDYVFARDMFLLFLDRVERRERRK